MDPLSVSPIGLWQWSQPSAAVPTHPCSWHSRRGHYPCTFPSARQDSRHWPKNTKIQFFIHARLPLYDCTCLLLGDQRAVGFHAQFGQGQVCSIFPTRARRFQGNQASQANAAPPEHSSGNSWNNSSNSWNSNHSQSRRQLGTQSMSEQS